MKIRQVAPDISGIRDDHVNRYLFAVDWINQLRLSGRILDVGCGVGYGGRLISDKCDIEVLGIDKAEFAVNYAHQHYCGEKTAFVYMDLKAIDPAPYSALTMFEIIEHSQDAPAFLKKASKYVRYLFGSVPNENVVPFARGRYNDEHYRHYTPDEIREELTECGWNVKVLGSQFGKKGAVADINLKDTSGRTIVFMAESMNLNA